MEPPALKEAGVVSSVSRTRSILRVNSYPSRAQVLLYIGRSPLVIPNLPLGVIHEFIAVNDQGRSWRALAALDQHGACASGNRETSRSAVPEPGGGPSVPRTSDAVESTPECEIVISLGEREIRRPAWDLGPTLLPRNVGTRGERLGSVRVVTKPPDLSVYQLVGFTPNARVENLTTGQSSEFVVYASGYQIERVLVTPGLWQDAGDAREASLDLSLKPKFR